MTLRVALCACLLGLGTVAAVRAAAAEVYDQGDRLELFVDQRQIEKLDGVRLVMHEPKRMETVLKLDDAWDGKYAAYFTVFQDGDRYRMYYRGWNGDAGSQQVACYAESRDGITFNKPKLGLHEFEGSKENNIILVGGSKQGTHNFTPFKDTRPGVPSDEQYKALGGGPLVAFASADGIHWRKLADKPVLTKGAFDSQNLAFWDPNRMQYVSYYRIFTNKVRAIAYATSDDFLTWSDPTPIDLGDTPPEHFYTNATTCYFRAPHYYFSFPKRFVPTRKLLENHSEKGISEGVFMSSRDGQHFDRTFMEAFIRPGRDELNWGDRSSMPVWGILQTAPDEMSIYYSQHYRYPSHHIERGVLRLDGIASAQAPYAGGELVTKPLRFSGDKLVLNYATSAVGSVRVEIQDADGKPIEGYTLDDAPELYGDQIAGPYAWKQGTDVSKLAGKPVKLRLVMKDADLYSYRFAAE
jgi:hypothetical protein